ncbi:MAG: DedA family protein [Proteobacteria bacterium]|nr:DedA family protein [Pseudomonadota bacterium]
MLGLFVASFLAATLVPLSSEILLFAYLKLHPDHAAAAIALATLGNTAGGLTTYLLGRLVPARMQARLDPRALAWLRRYGAGLTFFAWLPVVGDALCLGAGWLRLNALAVLAIMASGRLARYLLVAFSA